METEKDKAQLTTKVQMKWKADTRVKGTDGGMSDSQGGGVSSVQNAEGVGDVKFSGKPLYKGVRSNVISVTRGWARVKKALHAPREWPGGMYYQEEEASDFTIPHSLHTENHKNAEGTFLRA